MLLSLLAPLLLCAACSVSTTEAPTTSPGSGDAVPGATTPAGFTVLTPTYLGLVERGADAPFDETIPDAACAGKDVGAFFSFRDHSDDRDSLRFCLGKFSVPGRPASLSVCIDCDPAEKAAITNFYVGIATDMNAGGVADASFIAIAETDAYVRGQCQQTSFGDNLRAGYSHEPVRKDVPEQLASLQSGRGICTYVTVDDFHDLTHVTMASYKRAAHLTLTPVALAGRSGG